MEEAVAVLGDGLILERGDQPDGVEGTGVVLNSVIGECGFELAENARVDCFVLRAIRDSQELC